MDYVVVYFKELCFNFTKIFIRPALRHSLMKNVNTPPVVYLLCKSDGKRTYIGSTNNLHRRLKEHITGRQGARTTKQWRGQVDLVMYVSGFTAIKEARSF